MIPYRTSSPPSTFPAMSTPGGTPRPGRESAIVLAWGVALLLLGGAAIAVGQGEAINALTDRWADPNAGEAWGVIGAIALIVGAIATVCGVYFLASNVDELTRRARDADRPLPEGGAAR